MRRNILIAVSAVFILAIAVKIIARSGKAAVASIADVMEREGVPVETVKVSPKRVELWRSYSGVFEGQRQGMLFADTSLPVKAILRSVGDRVAEGDTIIKLDEAIKTQMVGSYRMSRLSYEQALREYNRVKALYDEGGVPQSVLEQAETGLNIARVRMDDTRAVVNLTSPISGVVTNISVSVGEMAHPGTPLATVADLSQMKAKLTVSETAVREIKAGQPMRVALDGGEYLYGKVTKVPLSAQPMTGLFTVEGLFSNAEMKLKPETMHEVEVMVAVREKTLTVPLDALLSAGGLYYVYKIAEEEGAKKARRVEVKTGLRLLTEIEVLEGLAAGDVVVVAGQNLLVDGDKVRLRESEAAAAAEKQ